MAGRQFVTRPFSNLQQRIGGNKLESWSKAEPHFTLTVLSGRGIFRLYICIFSLGFVVSPLSLTPATLNKYVRTMLNSYWKEVTSTTLSLVRFQLLTRPHLTWPRSGICAKYPSKVYRNLVNGSLQNCRSTVTFMRIFQGYHGSTMAQPWLRPVKYWGTVCDFTSEKPRNLRTLYSSRQDLDIILILVKKRCLRAL